MQEKLSLCASVSASVKWGELHLPLSTLQAGIPVSGSETVRHVARDSNVTAHSVEGGRRTVPGWGLGTPAEPGHKGAGETRCGLAKSTGVGAGKAPRWELQ